MAYHRETFGEPTDATGNATIQIGPVEIGADPPLYFLGYIVAQAVGSQATSYVLQDIAGIPVAGFSGTLAVLGPVYLKPQEYVNLVVSSGPLSGQIIGALVGDVAARPEDLVVRPAPTAAGAATTILNGPITAQGVTIIDAGGNAAILTRQTGVNADFIIRNTGTGSIILRPHDDSANDFAVSSSGSVSIAGGSAGVGTGVTISWPGYVGTVNQDATNNGTPSINWKASVGAVANSKFLWRMLPTGAGDSAVTGDRSELTWGGDSTPTWWGDRKVRQRIADNVRFLHVLSDSNVGVEPITRYVIELDGTAHSANVEQITFVRNTFIDGAAGDNQVMFDLKGDVGLIGLAQTKIAINGLKVGPNGAGADISLYLDDSANRTAFTRQTGANGDLIVRNFGTGNIALRPNDAGGNDFIIGTTGIFGPAGGPVNFGTAAVALGGGAAPVLGTIGGAGPAVAAQNAWMKVNILGVATYIPIWR